MSYDIRDCWKTLSDTVPVIASKCQGEERYLYDAQCIGIERMLEKGRERTGCTVKWYVKWMLKSDPLVSKATIDREARALSAAIKANKSSRSSFW